MNLPNLRIENLRENPQLFIIFAPIKTGQAYVSGNRTEVFDQG